MYFFFLRKGLGDDTGICLGFPKQIVVSFGGKIFFDDGTRFFFLTVRQQKELSHAGQP